MQIDEVGAGVSLPLERPLYQPPLHTALTSVALQAGDDDVDAAALFSQVRVDKAALSAHITRSLQTRSQVSLAELLQTRPLQQGLGELVAYLQLASEAPASTVDESTMETVEWLARGDADAGSDGPLTRRAVLPRVIFVRG
jgi:hypothetical protein